MRREGSQWGSRQEQCNVWLAWNSSLVKEDWQFTHANPQGSWPDWEILTSCPIMFYCMAAMTGQDRAGTNIIGPVISIYISSPHQYWVCDSPTIPKSLYSYCINISFRAVAEMFFGFSQLPIRPFPHAPSLSWYVNHQVVRVSRACAVKVALFGGGGLEAKSESPQRSFIHTPCWKQNPESRKTFAYSPRRHTQRSSPTTRLWYP